MSPEQLIALRELLAVCERCAEGPDALSRPRWLARAAALRAVLVNDQP